MTHIGFANFSHLSLSPLLFQRLEAFRNFSVTYHSNCILKGVDF